MEIYKRSLKIFQVVMFLRYFWLGCFLSIIFFKFIGMNDILIASFHLLMGIFIFLFEIPTGMFADKYGYKKSMILAFVALCFAFVSYVSSAFFGFGVVLLFSTFLFALFYAFSSGATQAYVYSAFKIDKNEKGYLPFNSRIAFFGSISTAIAVVVGSYLYLISEIIPYTLQAVFALVSIILLLFLKPIPRKEIHLDGILDQIKKSLGVFRKKQFLIVLFISLFLVNASFQFFEHLTNQSIWLEKGMTIELIGWLGISIFIIDGVFALLAPKLWNFFGERKVYFVLATLAVIFPIFLAFSQGFILIVIFSGLMYATATITLRIFDYSLQRSIGDSVRASVASVGNMFVSLGYKLSLLLVGFLLSFMAYSASLIIFALTFGLAGVIASIWLYFTLKK